MSDQQISIPHLVAQAQPQFERIAGQNQLVRWQEESQFAMQAIQKNPKLAECAPVTIQDAVINVAAVGLTLNPADGYAYLVPEYHKQNRRNECQLRVSFKGLVKIATDTGVIKWVKAEVVKANDTFEYRGVSETPVHRMDPFATDRGETVGVYCVAMTHDGVPLVDTINRAELDLIRQCAKSDNVWANWFDEMAKKAVIKRAAKQWPKSKESSTLHNAVEIINETEGSDFSGWEKIQEAAAQIHTHIAADDKLAIGEVWAEATEQEQSALWVAVSKGGFFTQAEKEIIRASATLYKKANATEQVDDAAPTYREIAAAIHDAADVDAVDTAYLLIHSGLPRQQRNELSDLAKAKKAGMQI